MPILVDNIYALPITAKVLLLPSSFLHGVSHDIQTWRPNRASHLRFSDASRINLFIDGCSSLHAVLPRTRFLQGGPLTIDNGSLGLCLAGLNGLGRISGVLI